uniref:Uncharacterized protein n=1 Tax=Faecalibaculum rodentium TaxID=1702221 RepID=A0A140DYB4_9FIRM|nr:hypothetical protein AALO17_25070 [Faecalibaculum rodentium]
MVNRGCCADEGRQWADCRWWKTGTLMAGKQRKGPVSVCRSLPVV